MRKWIAVFGIDILPRADFGRFRIKDEAIEVKDQCGIMSRIIPDCFRQNLRISREILSLGGKPGLTVLPQEIPATIWRLSSSQAASGVI